MTAFTTKEGVEAEAREAPPVWVLGLKGDLATFTEPKLREAYRTAAEAGARHVLLDFKEVGYINSSGVSVVIELLREAQENGRTLYFGGLDAHYRKVFQMMGLSQYGALVEDEVEAQALASKA